MELFRRCLTLNVDAFIWSFFSAFSLCFQPDAPSDSHSLPHEVSCRLVQRRVSIQFNWKAKDDAPSTGVHAGCFAHALWVSCQNKTCGWKWVLIARMKAFWTGAFFLPHHQVCAEWVSHSPCTVLFPGRFLGRGGHWERAGSSPASPGDECLCCKEGYWRSPVERRAARAGTITSSDGHFWSVWSNILFLVETRYLESYMNKDAIGCYDYYIKAYRRENDKHLEGYQ